MIGSNPCSRSARSAAGNEADPMSCIVRSWQMGTTDYASSVDARRFNSVIALTDRGRPVVAVPFDPDELWGSKALHHVSGTLDDRRFRARIERYGDGWAFTLPPTWTRDAGIEVGDDVTIELSPEGPQRRDLADDVAAALDANPQAAAFFDTLAQFYRKAYLRWIDATSRRPEIRAARIVEVVDLLTAGVKQRPRPSGQAETRSG
jgi:antitoxin component of MazEF toxin-antitoxin module